jgi:hypothetical protein
MKYRVEFFRPGGADYVELDIPNPQFWAAFRTLRGQPLYSARFVFNKVTAEVYMRYWEYTVWDPTVSDYVTFTPTASWKIRVNQPSGTFIEYYIESVVNVDEANEWYLITVSEIR